MRIDTFKMEEWINRYCSNARFDLTNACINPFTIRELMDICGIYRPLEIFDLKLTYGDIFGSDRLKNAISSLYVNQKKENITITNGAIGANQLVYQALLEKNDEVLCITPIYQQHYSIPKSLGANVVKVQLREENNWQINFKELENKLSYRTKLIVINFPNNPTGSIMSDENIYKLVEIARNYNLWILSDEVSRGLNLVGKPFSISIADIYDKGISVSSLSKAFSLPGLRLGWVIARLDLINEINKHREYNTISVSLINDYYASIALENKEEIINRNLKIMKNNLAILKNWLNQEIYVKMSLPQGGTTALVRYKKDTASRDLCEGLLKTSGVAILPGETFDMEGFVRIGYCIDSNKLEVGLNEFSKYIRKI